jgi:hypothetical protein
MNTFRPGPTFERRRAARYSFGGVAEVIDPESGKHVVGVTRELGTNGCFVKTKNIVPVSANVLVNITCNNRTFAALGRVVYLLDDEGMGIKFETITPADRAILTEWLAQSTGL